MFKRTVLLVLCVMFGLLIVYSIGVTISITVAAKQAQDHPFMAMLAFAPDNQATRDNIISYTDYHAIATSYPGVVWPKTADEWQKVAANKNNQTLRGLFSSVLPATSTPTNDWFRTLYHSDGSDTLKLTGINIYNINRALYFGTRPNKTIVLNGSYDPDVVAAAYQKRSYTKDDLNGMINGTTLWCGPVGCENGTKLDKQTRHTIADPFGGVLHRQQPVVFAQDYILSSPDLKVLKASVSAYQNGPTLTNNPNYLALAQALSRTEPILQAFVVPTSYIKYTTSLASTNLPSSTLSAIQSHNLNALMPSYSLVGFTQSTDQQSIITTMALVYANEADANKAASLLPIRFRQTPYHGSQTRTWNDVIKEQNGTLGAVEIFASPGTGKYVVVLSIRSPLTSSQATPDQSKVLVTDQIYSTLLDAMAQTGMPWLLTRDMIPAKATQ